MLKRLLNLIRGFLGGFVSDLEKSNPKALLEAEKENLQKQIVRYNENLTNQAAMTDRLMRQIEDLERREGKLVNQTAALLSANERELAGKTALELKSLREQIDENRRQLEMARNNFKELIKTRDAAIAETRQKIDKIRNLITETEMLEAQADLRQMAAPGHVATSGPGETLQRLETYLEERRSRAAGKIILTEQSTPESARAQQAADSVLAEAALKEFESQYLSSESENTDVPPERPVRDLGPMENEQS